jgi:trimeric autotransporter adhesin
MPANQITVIDSENSIELVSPGPQGVPGGILSLSLTSTGGTVSITGSTLDVFNPTGTFNIELATVGTPGTYASVTTDTYGRVTSGSSSQSIATGGTGLTSLGTSYQLLGVNSGATALEYKTISGTTNQIAVTNHPGSIEVGLVTSPVVSGQLTAQAVVATLYIAGSSGGVLAAGSNQSTAQDFITQIAYVSASGSGLGVKLPSFVGANFIVFNTSAFAVNVFPPSGKAIDSLATNAAFSLPAGAKVMFFHYATNLYGTLNATYG